MCANYFANKNRIFVSILFVEPVLKTLNGSRGSAGNLTNGLPSDILLFSALYIRGVYFPIKKVFNFPPWPPHLPKQYFPPKCCYLLFPFFVSFTFFPSINENFVFWHKCFFCINMYLLICSLYSSAHADYIYIC